MSFGILAKLVELQAFFFLDKCFGENMNNLVVQTEQNLLTPSFTICFARVDG